MVERLVYQGPATQLVVRLANGESLQALVQNQGQSLSWQQVHGHRRAPARRRPARPAGIGLRPHAPERGLGFGLRLRRVGPVDNGLHPLPLAVTLP